MIKVLLFGTGCDLCREIADNIDEVIRTGGYDAAFEKTSDLHRMLSYGIKSTPSVVINDAVVSVSKALSVEEITRLMEAAARSSEAHS